MKRTLAIAAVFVACAIANVWLATTIGAHRLASAQPEVECLHAAGRHRVVYLHGIDSFGPSWQELENRATVARLADALDLAIAIPRAPQPCPGSPASRCWPMDGDTTLSAIRTASQRCFGATDRVGVLAFSNGGFAAAAAFQRCRARDFAWVAIVGAGAVNGETTDLAACGRIAIAIGADDRYHHDAAVQLAATLRTRGARVELVELDGGHRLDFEALRGLLAPLVAR